MANNFTCDHKVDGDTLNLILGGCFDGSSAWEIAVLVDDKYRKNKGIKHVVIDTKDVVISKIPADAMSFGIDVWKKLYASNEIPQELSYQFIGGKIKIGGKTPRTNIKL